MAQVTQNLEATVSVVDACTLGAPSVATLDFGTNLAVGATSNEADTTFAVDCNDGAPWTLAAEFTGGETVNNRLMTGAIAGNTSAISWELFAGDGCATPWGDAITDPITGTGPQTVDVSGCILNNTVPNVQGDTYTEEVTVDLTFT